MQYLNLLLVPEIIFVTKSCLEQSCTVFHLIAGNRIMECPKYVLEPEMEGFSSRLLRTLISVPGSSWKFRCTIFQVASPTRDVQGLMLLLEP